MAGLVDTKAKQNCVTVQTHGAYVSLSAPTLVSQKRVIYGSFFHVTTWLPACKAIYKKAVEITEESDIIFLCRHEVLIKR